MCPIIEFTLVSQITKQKSPSEIEYLPLEIRKGSMPTFSEDEHRWLACIIVSSSKSLLLICEFCKHRKHTQILSSHYIYKVEEKLSSTTNGICCSKKLRHLFFNPFIESFDKPVEVVR